MELIIIAFMSSVVYGLAIPFGYILKEAEKINMEVEVHE